MSGQTREARRRSPRPWRGAGATGQDLLDPATWRAGLYVLLALPAGLLTLALLLGGAALGLLTLPLLMGAPLLLGTLWLVGGLAEVQRWLSRLLGLHLARPALAPAYTTVGAWLRATLGETATYRALLFHVSQFPLAALCWAALFGLLVLALGGLSLPLWATGFNVRGAAWGGETLRLGGAASAGGLLLGLGAALLLGGSLNLMGRVWRRLSVALLGLDPAAERSRREVAALRRAAGRVALGDDLDLTLRDLTAQALAGSTARCVQLLSPSGEVRAHSGAGWAGGDGPLPAPEANSLAPSPLPGTHLPLTDEGQARLGPAPAGTLNEAGTVAELTVPLPAGVAGGFLRALYPAGRRPSAEELGFLLSIANHAGTALHAAELIERATVRAGEQERARLARELHDSVAQALYGITLGAKTARASLGRDPERAGASLDYTIRLAEGGVSEMKALLFSLRPDALEEGGLSAALGQQAHALSARHGLRVEAALEGEPALSPPAQAAAYRIAQEALHNVVKHARAEQVWLSLREEDAGAVLEIRDDGRGFDPERQGRGTLGQRSMRERAAGVGGTLSVQSAPGAGTRVRLWLPLTEPDGTDTGPEPPPTPPDRKPDQNRDPAPEQANP